MTKEIDRNLFIQASAIRQLEKADPDPDSYDTEESVVAALIINGWSGIKTLRSKDSYVDALHEDDKVRIDQQG